MLVMMSTQSNNSLLFFKSLSIPVGALQHQESKETVPACTLNPNIPTSCNRKNQQKPNKGETLHIICGYPLCAEYHDPDQLPLRRPEPHLQHNPKTSPVECVDQGLQPCAGCAPGASLEDLGATEEDGTVVLTINVQVIFALEELDGLFEKGSGFAREHGLVDDASTKNEEDVSRDGGFCLLADCVWR